MSITGTDATLRKRELRHLYGFSVIRPSAPGVRLATFSLDARLSFGLIGIGENGFPRLVDVRPFCRVIISSNPNVSKPHYKATGSIEIAAKAPSALCVDERVLLVLIYDDSESLREIVSV